MNWSNLINELQAAGFSREEIAKSCACSKWLIDKLVSGGRGKRLSFSIADSLIKLHEKEIGRKATF